MNKQRVSWKTVIAQNADAIEKGLTIEVATPTPAQHIALRSAALSAGYSAWMRGGTTYVAKPECANAQLVGNVKARVHQKLTPCPPLKFGAPTTPEQAKTLIHNAFYRLLCERPLQKEYPQGTEAWIHIDKLPYSVWVLIEQEELDLAQPSFATLRELIEWHYENNRLDEIWAPWLSATARFNCSQFELFKRLDENIPVMNEDEASHLLILRAAKRRQELQDEMHDKRRQAEADKGWNEAD